MNDNDKIDNTAGPPGQNSGCPTHQQQEAMAPRTGDIGCCSATDSRLPAPPGLCQPSSHPSIHQSVLPAKPSRRPRAPYRHRNHRRTGKVARLPRAIRNEIALRFIRYEEYKNIIAWLASQGHPGISESNLSRWRKGGFQDWLRDEQKKRLDLIDVALDVLEELVLSEQNKLTPAESCHLSSKPTSHSSKNPSTSSLPNLLGGGSESTLNT